MQRPYWTYKNPWYYFFTKAGAIASISALVLLLAGAVYFFVFGPGSSLLPNSDSKPPVAAPSSTSAPAAPPTQEELVVKAATDALARATADKKTPIAEDPNTDPKLSYLQQSAVSTVPYLQNLNISLDVPDNAETLENETVISAEFQIVGPEPANYKVVYTLAVDGGKPVVSKL